MNAVDITHCSIDEVHDSFVLLDTDGLYGVMMSQEVATFIHDCMKGTTQAEQRHENYCNCNKSANQRNTRKSIFFTCNDTVNPENVLKLRASNESEMSSFDRNLFQCQHEPPAVPLPRFCYPCSVWPSSPWMASILARYLDAQSTCLKASPFGATNSSVFFHLP